MVFCFFCVCINDKCAGAVALLKNVSFDFYLADIAFRNNYLMKLIRQNTTFAIEIAERTITDFKEAMIFAFLGVLRVRNEANCLQSVTGASRSCCSGTILQWI